MRRLGQKLAGIILGSSLGITGILAIGYYRQSNAAPNYEYLDVFTKVLHFVQSNYVEEVDTKKLIEGAIKGMLATLDPHTVYLPPDQFKEMQVDTSGKFGGLGIEITIQDGMLTVVTPIDDTPAFREGVEPGDKIVRIVDKEAKVDVVTKDLTLHEAVKLMRGKAGTPITIHVVRPDKEKPLPITITRAIIKVKSVKSGLIEPNYGWLRISNFQSNTSRELARHLDDLKKANKGQPLEGLVLDLRSNPGGLLEEAVSVSSLFLDSGVPVVSTMGRSKARKEVEFAKYSKPYKEFRMVILVNEYSASASEIVAGALQDHKRALIVGKPTFGKGSVQTVIDLDNKAGLKLTVARYYTPSGRSIQSEGIVPDIEVERIDAELLKKAKEGKALREADLKGHIRGERETEGDGPAIKEPEEDPKKKKPDDQRPIKEIEGKKIRIDDPKVLIETDFQLQQALSYLKAWNVFQAAGNFSSKQPGVQKAEKQ